MSSSSGRLYDHFQRERAVFKRWLLILVSLSAFFLFVFEPYISATRELGKTQRRLDTLEQEIDQAQREIEISTGGIERASNFLGDASAFQALYDDARSWVQDMDGIRLLYNRQSRHVAMLRDALPPELQNRWRPNYQPNEVIIALRREHPEVMRNYKEDRCFFEIELDWVKCQVNGKLQPINKRLSRVLYDRTMSHEYTKELQDTVQSNRNRYDEGFETALAEQELVPWVQGYLEEERKIIRRWYETMADTRSALTRNTKKQRDLLDNHIVEREALKLSRQELSKLGKPQTPFGPLPLTFQGILVLLPSVLLLTAILLVRSQHRLYVFREHYIAYSPPEEDEKSLLNLIMPLSPDPDGNTVGAIGVLLGYSLPVIIALLGAKRLVSIPELAGYGDQITVLGIVPITAILLVVFVFYLRGLALAWRNASLASRT